MRTINSLAPPGPARSASPPRFRPARPRFRPARSRPARPTMPTPESRLRPPPPGPPDDASSGVAHFTDAPVQESGQKLHSVSVCHLYLLREVPRVLHVTPRRVHQLPAERGEPIVPFLISADTLGSAVPSLGVSL